MTKIKKEGVHKFLNQLSRDIKNNDLKFETYDDQFKLSEKLRSMIGTGSGHRDKRIIELMKKAHKVKPYADPYALDN